MDDGLGFESGCRFGGAEDSVRGRATPVFGVYSGVPPVWMRAPEPAFAAEHAVASGGADSMMAASALPYRGRAPLFRAVRQSPAAPAVR